MLLHHRQKFDNHLGGGSDEDLALSTSLCIAHALQSIVENTDAHHRYFVHKVRFNLRRDQQQNNGKYNTKK